MWRYYPRTSTGTIIYDPPRPAKIREKEGRWAIIDVDPEITRYYRWWVDREIYNKLAFDKGGLVQPSFDAHISIIRGYEDTIGYEDKVDELWKKYHGQEVSFNYGIHVRQTKKSRRGNARYWFVDVHCEMWHVIRDEIGFTNPFNCHLTIGKERE